MDAHIVPVPKWYTIIRYVQLLLALVVLGLAAYDVAWINSVLQTRAFYSSGPPFAIFVAVATILVLVYYIVSTTIAKRLYNRGPVMILEVFSTLWWLGCAGNLGYWATWADMLDDQVNWTTYRAVLIAAAVIAAVNFILFLVTLITYVVHYRRYTTTLRGRQFGGNAYGNSWQAPPPPSYGGAPPPSYFPTSENKGAGMQGYEMQNQPPHQQPYQPNNQYVPPPNLNNRQV